MNTPLFARYTVLFGWFFAVSLASVGVAVAQDDDNIFRGAFDERETGVMARDWKFYGLKPGEPYPFPLQPGPDESDLCDLGSCEAIFEVDDYGAGAFFGNAGLELFSSDTGVTHWLIAATPTSAFEEIEVGAIYRQKMHFLRTSDQASLTLKITASELELDDQQSGGLATLDSCGPVLNEFCTTLLASRMRFKVTASQALLDARFEPEFQTFRTGGSARLKGLRDDWTFTASTTAGSDQLFWGTGDFDFDPAVDGRASHAKATLQTPFPVTCRSTESRWGIRYYWRSRCSLRRPIV